MLVSSRRIRRLAVTGTTVTGATELWPPWSLKHLSLRGSDVGLHPYVLTGADHLITLDVSNTGNLSSATHYPDDTFRSIGYLLRRFRSLRTLLADGIVWPLGHECFFNAITSSRSLARFQPPLPGHGANVRQYQRLHDQAAAHVDSNRQRQSGARPAPAAAAAAPARAPRPRVDYVFVACWSEEAECLFRDCVTEDGGSDPAAPNPRFHRYHVVSRATKPSVLPISPHTAEARSFCCAALSPTARRSKR